MSTMGEAVRAGTVPERLPETEGGSGCPAPLTCDKKKSRPQTMRFRQSRIVTISRLPGLFSYFHQPSGSAFALIGASRLNVNFCEGSSE